MGRCWSLFASWGHGDVWAGLLPRAMSGSLVLQKPVPVLMSMAPVAVKCHDDSHGLGCLLGAVLASISHAAAGALQITRGHGDHQTQAFPKDPMSGSVVLLQLRSMLMPMSHVATKGHMNPWVWAATHGLVGVQEPHC